MGSHYQSTNVHETEIHNKDITQRNNNVENENNHYKEHNKEIFEDAEALVKDFESDDASKVINGIKIISSMLKHIKSAVGDCGGIALDLKKLEAMVEIFASPTSFVYHVGKDLLINGVQIFHLIDDATTQYK